MTTILPESLVHAIAVFSHPPKQEEGSHACLSLGFQKTLALRENLGLFSF
ncbi:hypothetical protein ACHAXM_005520, partial [Skeletonema potamos]